MKIVIPHQGHDITRIGGIDGFAILRKQALAVRKTNLFPRARVGNVHVAFESTRNNSNVSRAVAVLRVHVRLDLEHESREVFFVRIHQALLSLTRRRRRSQLEESIEHELHTKVVHRRTKENRHLLTR